MTRIMNHDEVVINIKALLKGAGPPVTNDCSIYRVPFDIRKLNQDAYTPKIVSIGPLHHKGNPRLQNMERHKLVYCNAFIDRTQTSLDTWIRYIEEMEPDFRRCYSETLVFSKEKLVEIIFVDSGFIFELFMKCYHVGGLSGNDTFLLNPLMSNTILVDLLLFENQPPFHVLNHLFNLSFGNSHIPSFIELTFRYFSYYNKSHLSFRDDNIRISHFTDLIRTFHLQHPSESRPCRINQILQHLPSANELSEAVNFKVLESNCLLDLRFSQGVLHMPVLRMEDNSEVLFRNMVALEQCHYPFESYITDYVDVLNFLVNSRRDVDTLVQQGVLVNWLRDTDSVANVFNSLCENITQATFNSNYFDLCKGLNGFYRNPWHRWKSALRRDYCSSPWQTATTIAAILLLIFSLIQTVCSILQVLQQP